jgi:hypothetical protein
MIFTLLSGKKLSNTIIHHTSNTKGATAPFLYKYSMDTFKQFYENFRDGRNPQDKGDMARHGLKGKSISQLKKIRSSDSASPRAKQLAHWFINMHKKH